MLTQSDRAQEGERAPPANPNSPQQHGTRRVGNVPTDSLDQSSSKPAGLERQSIREASPLRPQFSASARGTARSRKNSQELSPTRNTTNPYASHVPSAAAVQRALSAHKPPSQVVSIDSALEARNPGSTDSTPRWPISPRLTSPPPSRPPRNGPQPNRKQDNDMATPNSSQKRTSTSVPDLTMTTPKPIPEKEDNINQRSASKPSARGVSGVAPTLETVAENSVPDTPSMIPPSERSMMSSPLEYTDHHKEELQHVAPPPKSAKWSGDSESDNAETKTKPDAVSKPGDIAGSKPASNLAKRSLTNLVPTKNKAPEPPTRSMTVETETVSSVPQAPLNVAADRGASGKLDASGSVRLKPSSEMIKPKKEKKRNARRPTSINTGTSTLLYQSIPFLMLTNF